MGAMRVPVSSLNPTFDQTVEVGFWRWLTATRQERRMWRWLRTRATVAARPRLVTWTEETQNLTLPYIGRRRAQ